MTLFNTKRKKNDEKPTSLKVDRQVTVASKKNWMKSEAESLGFFFSSCVFQVPTSAETNDIHTLCISLAETCNINLFCSKSQADRKKMGYYSCSLVTRGSQAVVLQFRFLSCLKLFHSNYSVCTSTVLAFFVEDHCQHWGFVACHVLVYPYQIHPQPLHQCHGGERFLRESQV